MGSEANEFNNEMSKLAEKFKGDVKKIMKDKRKCIGELASNCVKRTRDVVEEHEQNQLQRREKIVEDFKTEFHSFIQMGVAELNKLKEIEDQVKELLELKRLSEEKKKEDISKQMKDVTMLNEEFRSDMKNLEETHEMQTADLMKTTKKKLMQIQKKMLMETQKHEKENLRNCSKLSF